MKLPILQIGADVLVTPAKKVENLQSEEIKSLIRNLLDTCKAGEKYTAGLAAPQVGASWQITVVRRVDLEEAAGKEKLKPDNVWEVLVNPEIIEIDDKEETLMWEGCLSIGVKDSMLYGPVYRPNHVKIRYLTPTGETKTISGTDYFSHLLQHELDHLKGVLFINYVPNPELNLWRAEEFERYMDKNGDYPPIRS